MKALPVDLLCPCARFHTLHADNVADVRAAAVVAGANDPMSLEAEAALAARDIAALPAFLTNCGGVLGGTLEFAGVPAERIGPLIEPPVRRLVQDLLARAARTGLAVGRLAEADALERHAAVRARAEHPGPAGRMVAAAVAAYHRGWVPRALVSRAATRYVLGGLA
jgi:glutamate dehydrogenase/leucine dehydrogenase